MAIVSPPPPWFQRPAGRLAPRAAAPQFMLAYTGKIDGDAITGTVDFGGMGSSAWTAKRKK